MDVRTDAELIAAAKTDPELFGVLWIRYQKRIFGYCYRMVGNQHDAEDLTAATFMKAFQHLPRYEHRGAPYIAYLVRIARNQAMTDQRRAKWRSDVDPFHVISDTAPDPADIVIQQDSANWLLALLRELPAYQAAAVVAINVHGYSSAETATMLDRNPGAVKSAAHRGRTAMAAMI